MIRSKTWNNKVKKQKNTKQRLDLSMMRWSAGLIAGTRAMNQSFIVLMHIRVISYLTASGFFD